ncbi:MAG: AAA+ family ATPase [Roseinatronobacter sp.]
MRVFVAFVVCLNLIVAPAAAQDTPPSFGDKLNGIMQLFRDRLAPKMEEGLQVVEPELRDLLARLQGMVQYHAPEILPNGDILIRRRAPESVPDHLPDKVPSEPPVTSPLEL